jgi:hypothetical protein
MIDFITMYEAMVAPELQQSLFPLKVLVIIVSAIMLLAAIWFLANTSYLNNLWLDDWRDYKVWKKRYSPRAKKGNWQSKQNVAPFGVVSERVRPEQSGPSRSTQPVEPPIQREMQQTVPRTDWERILDKLESGRSLNYNLALLDADKLLEKKLDGKELDEFYLQKINWARSLVEDVMADDSRDLTLEEVGEAIDVYKKALESLD